jgi:hypothetical protein
MLLLAFLALAAVTTALASRSHEPQQLRFARGVSDGSFHPIAGKFVPDDTKLDDCGADPRCLEQGFGNLAYTAGPKTALALFDRRRVADKAVAADCHRIAHTIGSAALVHFHGNVALTYSHGSASCTSGYYHGILERAFVRVHSTPGLIRTARSLCRGAAIRRSGFLDYQCAHGLGHGLMIQTGYDLPTALAVCSGLETRWDEISCAGGVFMENGSTVYGLRSQWLKDDDPVFPCNRIKVRHRGSCYLRVTTQMLRTNRFDWRDTVNRCQALAKKWRRNCFRSYGRDAAHSTGGKTAPTIRLCHLTGSWEGQCLFGAARTIADRDANPSHAAILCRGVIGPHQGACFAGLGIVVGLLQATDARRVEACRRLSERHVRQCARAAILEIEPDGRGAWG